MTPQTPLDVIGHIADISAIPIAAIGFGVTFWQIRKARTAAESAREAATHTKRNIGRSSLLLLLPQLQKIEEELERAVRTNATELAITCLGNWKWQAAQLRGLLGIMSPEDKEFRKLLQASVTSASTAKSDLIGTAGGSLIDITKMARQSISRITGEIGSLAVEHGLTNGEVSGNE